MKKENFFITLFDNIAMFLWMLIPATPMLAGFAFLFLSVTSIWFWVSCIVPVILIAVTRPHLGSCSQWENVYWDSIIAAVILLILRLCGVFPLV